MSSLLYCKQAGYVVPLQNTSILKLNIPVANSCVNNNAKNKMAKLRILIEDFLTKSRKFGYIQEISIKELNDLFETNKDLNEQEYYRESLVKILKLITNQKNPVSFLQEQQKQFNIEDRFSQQSDTFSQNVNLIKNKYQEFNKSLSKMDYQLSKQETSHSSQSNNYYLNLVNNKNTQELSKKSTTETLELQKKEQQEFQKIKIGLPNFNQNCYLNCSLQALRQIFYLNQNVFSESDYGQGLIKLFKSMENGFCVQKLLQQLLQVDNQFQQSSFGGDAYLSLLILLNKIRKQSTNKQFFEKCFKLKYSDILKCNGCNNYQLPKYYQNTDQQNSWEVNSIKELFESKFKWQQEMFFCEKCKGPRYYTNVRYFENSPQFIIIRLNFTCGKNNLNEVYKSDNEKYKIIGFGSYSGYHYTYQAQYSENKWICFSDTSVYDIQYPNLDNALFFILQKL